jgi:hypothetical protein
MPGMLVTGEFGKGFCKSLFWLTTHQIAGNQSVKGFRVLSKIVPAVTDTVYLQALQR